jgi:hypothetical protein
MGFRFSLNETIFEIAILELGNNSYSIFWFFPNFTILNLFFRKSHFRVWNPNSKIYGLHFWSDVILNWNKIYWNCQSFIWYLKILFKLF